MGQNQVVDIGANRTGNADSAGGIQRQVGTGTAARTGNAGNINGAAAARTNVQHRAVSQHRCTQRYRTGDCRTRINARRTRHTQRTQIERVIKGTQGTAQRGVTRRMRQATTEVEQRAVCITQVHRTRGRQRHGIQHIGYRTVEIGAVGTAVRHRRGVDAAIKVQRTARFQTDAANTVGTATQRPGKGAVTGTGNRQRTDIRTHRTAHQHIARGIKHHVTGVTTRRTAQIGNGHGIGNTRTQR